MSVSGSAARLNAGKSGKKKTERNIKYRMQGALY
jgi:hypothetical protein